MSPNRILGLANAAAAHASSTALAATRLLNFRQLGRLMLGVLIFAGASPAALAAIAASPTPPPAQVWFLRPSSPASEVYGAEPMIYANGAAVGTIPANSEFHRNFAPGTYSFTVQPYGIATGAADTLNLLPGSRSYLEVISAPVWEENYFGGSRGYNSRSFFPLNLSPQLARAYLPGLTALQ
jgi:hypothetical protein